MLEVVSRLNSNDKENKIRTIDKNKKKVLIVMLLAVPVFSQGAVDHQAELNKKL